MPQVVQPEPFSEGETAVEPFTAIEAEPARCPRRGDRRSRPRDAGERPQPARRQARRHHRDPPGHQVGRRLAGRAGAAIGAPMAITPSAPHSRNWRSGVAAARIRALVLAVGPAGTASGDIATGAPAAEAGTRGAALLLQHRRRRARPPLRACRRRSWRGCKAEIDERIKALEAKRARIRAMAEAPRRLPRQGRGQRRQDLCQDEARRSRRTAGRGQDRACRRHPHEARSAPGEHDPQRNGQQGGRDASPASWPAPRARRTRHDPRLASPSSRLALLAGCSTAFKEIGVPPTLSPVGSGIAADGHSIYSYPQKPAGPVKKFSLWDDRQSRLFTDPRALAGRRHPDRPDLDQRPRQAQERNAAQPHRQAQPRARRLIRRRRRRRARRNVEGEITSEHRHGRRRATRRDRKASTCRSRPSSPKCCPTAI